MTTTTDRPVDQPDHPTTSRGWLVVALVLVLAGAFVVSATSTWLLGERHHLDAIARTALILMLEVGSVTGAAIYVATRRAGLRVRAGLVVAIATSVAATGGVQAYGFLIGLPVAALLLLLVDTIAVYWHETSAHTGVVDRVDLAVTTGSSAPGEDRAPVRRDMIDGELPSAPGDPVDQLDQDDEELILDEATGEPKVFAPPPAPTLGPVEGPVTLVGHLRGQPRLPSERDLVSELGITRYRAKVALREARTGLSAVSAS